MMNEKKVMKMIRHPFCVRLYSTYKDKNNLYFLFEPAMGGELFSILRSWTMFDEATARFYAASIVLVIEHLHSKQMIYRDLKPENVLLDKDGFVKLTDFGFAKEVTGRTWTLCGTPDYLAPEIVAGRGHGKAVDWWCLGVFIFEMLASYPPFYDDDRLKTYSKIIHGRIHFPAHFSKEAVDLITNLLQIKPTERYGIVKGGVSLIKRHPFFKGFDFEKLYFKQITPPVVPKLSSAEDLRNFDQNQKMPLMEPYVDDGNNWDADF